MDINLFLTDISSSTKNWKQEDVDWFQSLVTSHLERNAHSSSSSSSSSTSSQLSNSNCIDIYSKDSLLGERSASVNQKAGELRCIGYGAVKDKMLMAESSQSSANSIISITSNSIISSTCSDVPPLPAGSSISAATSCRKKSKHGCIHKLCFNCCLQISILCDQPGAMPSAVCNAHASARAKREEEDRLVRVSLFSNLGQKKKRFDHFEERFTDYGQTVLIWFIGDFLRNKKWSDDTISSLIKQQRQKSLRRKRDVAFMKSHNTGSGDHKYLDDALSSSSSSSSTSMNGDHMMKHHHSRASSSSSSKKRGGSASMKRKSVGAAVHPMKQLPRSVAAEMRYETLREKWQRQAGSTAFILSA